MLIGAAHTWIMTETLDATGLPPVAVDCGWCATQFLSRAKHMQSVHCPRCKHSIRVKRKRDYPLSPSPVPPPAQTEPDAQAASLPLRAEACNPIPPTPPTGVGGPAGDYDDEGDETYIYDQAGRLVLAEWTSDAS
jgi:DNA-directed RNA polymerase subunit RPC12/RpoP